MTARAAACHHSMLAQTDVLRDMRERGLTWGQVAAALGVSAATAIRLGKRRRDFDAGKRRDLAPRTAPGGPALADKLTPEARDFLKRKVLQCGSKALTAYYFAHDPLCPDDLREKFLTMKSIPLSIRRAMHVTADAKAHYRGPKAESAAGIKCSHDGMVIEPASGRRRELAAGDIYLSDDMSRNIPFWFELADGERETRARRGDKLAERHGVAIGRQGLFTMDARGKLLGVSLIGCARDAYTSADVLRHFWRIVSDFGYPRLQWVLEKGVWSSRCIDGSRVWCSDEEREQMVSGLGQFGFDVCHVSTSQGKALIEGWFNFFQRAQSLQEGAPDIGRNRGEMEREAALMRRIQAGVVHPAEAGMPDFAEALKMDFDTCVFLNAKPKSGRIQRGVPDEVWARDTAARPLTTPASEHRGHFLPVKLETEIRGGHVEKKIAGDVFRFTIPELFAVCGSHYRVLMCFDPTDPESGAEIYNLERGARNEQGFAFMQHIGTAEYAAPRPLFGYSDEVAADVARRKRYQRAVKTAYAGTGLFGKRASWAVEARDGLGAVSRIEISAGQSGSSPIGAGSASGSPSRLAGPDVPAATVRVPAPIRRRELTEEDVARLNRESDEIEAQMRANGQLLGV